MRIRIATTTTILCFFTCLYTAGSLTAQEATKTELPSAKEIIARNLAATAKQAAIDSLKSLAVEASVSIPQAGLTGDMTLFQSNDGKAVVKVSFPGIGNQELGTDGDNIWEVSQITGAEVLEGERAEQARLQLSLNAFAHYEDFFDKMECTGVEEFEGEQCYVLKSQNGDSDPIYDYFSVDTGLQVGNKLKAATAVGKMEITSLIGDHKKVGDFTMPHKTVAKLPNGMTQEVTIKSMKFNGEIPPETFNVPEEVKELLK